MIRVEIFRPLRSKGKGELPPDDDDDTLNATLHIKLGAKMLKRFIATLYRRISAFR